MAEITEEKLAQIENDLIRFFKHVALPRFMKEIRDNPRVEMLDEKFNFIEEFSNWFYYYPVENLTTNEIKDGN